MREDTTELNGEAFGLDILSLALIELVLMLVEQNNELRRRIKDVERRGHRQAISFSKGTTTALVGSSIVVKRWRRL